MKQLSLFPEQTNKKNDTIDKICFKNIDIEIKENTNDLTLFKKNLNLENNKNFIGAIQTPLRWASWLIEHGNIIDHLLNGEMILEPSCGEGNFLDAIISKLKKTHQNNKIIEIMQNIILVEKEQELIEKMKKNIFEKYNIQSRHINIVCKDFLEWSCDYKFNIIIGNPPWCTFGSLPNSYKEFVKHYFEKFQLVQKKNILLGNSRVDISTLFVQKIMQEHIEANGKLLMYLPLSLLFNEGANNLFRRFQTNKNQFSVYEIYDLTNCNVFQKKIGTKYGMIVFQNSLQHWPIKFFDVEKNTIHHIYEKENKEIAFSIDIKNHKYIDIYKQEMPRQGLNTCGANQIFFVEKISDISNELALIKNGYQEEFILPSKYLYPLITKNNFQNSEDVFLYVILPYYNDGKILTLLNDEYLNKYFLKYKEKLKNRKGVMINSFMSKGQWWSLMGIGVYSFAPWKIVWQSYGKKEFKVKKFSAKNNQIWQPNQSLQSFIPCFTEERADLLCKKFSENWVEEILKSYRAEGSMNWAQPGRIKNILNII
jgi:hypothetical protein